MTLFRPAEILVVSKLPSHLSAADMSRHWTPHDVACPVQVVVPVGQAPPELWSQYCSLVTKHRQIELQLLRSFYKEQQKSPFTHLPWKAGALHFRFPWVGAQPTTCPRWLQQCPCGSCD